MKTKEWTVSGFDDEDGAELFPAGACCQEYRGGSIIITNSVDGVRAYEIALVLAKLLNNNGMDFVQENFSITNKIQRIAGILAEK